MTLSLSSLPVLFFPRCVLSTARMQMEHWRVSARISRFRSSASNQLPARENACYQRVSVPPLFPPRCNQPRIGNACRADVIASITNNVVCRGAIHARDKSRRMYNEY